MSYIFDSVDQQQQASRLLACRNNIGNNAACKRMVMDKLSGGSYHTLLRILVDAENLIASLNTQLAQPRRTLQDELTPTGFK